MFWMLILIPWIGMGNLCTTCAGCAEEGGPEGASGSTMGLLSGTWRLVYSSAFASGSLGGLRPGPQAALIPVTIGQVPVQACCPGFCCPAVSGFCRSAL